MNVTFPRTVKHHFQDEQLDLEYDFSAAYRHKKSRGKLFSGTVPPNNTLFSGKVPTNNTIFGRTVLPNSTLFGGTPDLEI